MHRLGGLFAKFRRPRQCYYASSPDTTSVLVVRHEGCGLLAVAELADQKPLRAESFLRKVFIE